MTDEELEQIERALAEMTPEPWEYERDTHAVFGGDGFDIVADLHGQTHGRNGPGIALLRNKGAALVAEVRRLRAALEAASQQEDEILGALGHVRALRSAALDLLREALGHLVPTQTPGLCLRIEAALITTSGDNEESGKEAASTR